MKTEYIPKLSFLNTRKDTFNRILSEACEYKIGKIASPIKEAAKLAETIKQLQLPPDNDFVNHIMVIVYEIINIKKTSLSLREKAMTKWYKESVNPNNLSLWKQFIKDLNFTFTESTVLLLFQFVMDKFLKHGLKFRNSLLESKNVTQVQMDNQILESDDEESLRYVAGYVLYLLKNSFKNSDPYLKKAVSGIIGIWGGKKGMGCSNNITFLEYTQYWVEKVNCGGLIYVTDDFYKFIRQKNMLYEKF